MLDGQGRGGRRHHTPMPPIDRSYEVMPREASRARGIPGGSFLGFARFRIG
jgi:hypothetical protein